MQLKLALGIDQIKFGLTKDEIISLIGIPDRIEIDEDDENEIVCDWNEHKFRLTFYKTQNMKLGYIQIKNENVTFNDFKIIGQPIEFVLEKIFKEINNWEIEKYAFFTTYFNEEFWLALYVDYNIVEEIKIGVPFKNELEYNWPQ